MAATRRGIQSVYFLALQNSFVSNICTTLQAAPGGTRVEIEFSAAHAGSNGWANAQTAIHLLQSRGLNLVVDFGHHTVALDHTPSDWGASLSSGLFKHNWSRI